MKGQDQKQQIILRMEIKQFGDYCINQSERCYWFRSGNEGWDYVMRHQVLRYILNGFGMWKNHNNQG